MGVAGAGSGVVSQPGGQSVPLAPGQSSARSRRVRRGPARRLSGRASGSGHQRGHHDDAEARSQHEADSQAGEEVDQASQSSPGAFGRPGPWRGLPGSVAQRAAEELVARALGSCFASPGGGVRLPHRPPRMARSASPGVGVRLPHRPPRARGHALARRPSAGTCDVWRASGSRTHSFVRSTYLLCPMLSPSPRVGEGWGGGAERASTMPPGGVGHPSPCAEGGARWRPRPGVRPARPAGR
jgi:hypothetical protein